MKVVLPRLDRTAALELLDQYRGIPLPEISHGMPDLNPVVTYSPVGGNRITPAELAELRREPVGLAQRRGLPAGHKDISGFESEAARIIHARLNITAHEASEEQVWTYLTC